MPGEETSPPKPPPRAARSNTKSNSGRQSLRFSLRTMAIIVTGFCLLLGVSAAFGPGLFVSVVASIVSFILQVWAPVVIVIAAIYARGYPRTFFLGISLAILAHRLGTSSAFGGRLYQGQFGFSDGVRAVVGMSCYLVAGVLAVWARRIVERRGWNRP